MIYLKNLIENIEISNLPKSQIKISDITNDSRKVKPGSAFIAISGYNKNGKNYICLLYTSPSPRDS